MKFATTYHQAISPDGRLRFKIHRLAPGAGECDIDLQFYVTLDGNTDGRSFQALDLPGVPGIVAVRIRTQIELTYLLSLKKKLGDERNDVDFIVDIANAFIEMLVCGASLVFDTRLLFTIDKGVFDENLVGIFPSAPPLAGDHYILASLDAQAEDYSQVSEHR